MCWTRKQLQSHRGGDLNEVKTDPEHDSGIVGGGGGVNKCHSTPARQGAVLAAWEGRTAPVLCVSENTQILGIQRVNQGVSEKDTGEEGEGRNGKYDAQRADASGQDRGERGCQWGGQGKRKQWCRGDGRQTRRGWRCDIGRRIGPGRGLYKGICANHRLLSHESSLKRMGLCQLGLPPNWRDQGWQPVEVVVVGPCSPTIAQVRSARREGCMKLFLISGRGAWQSLSAPLERQAVHRLPDGDPAACPPHVGRAGNPAAPPPPTGCLEGRTESFAGWRHHAHVREVPYRDTSGGQRVVEGEDLHQTLPPWESMGRGLVDHGQGAGQSLPAWGHLLKDMGEDAECNSGKASGGTSINWSQLQLLHRRDTDASAS